MLPFYIQAIMSAQKMSLINLIYNFSYQNFSPDVLILQFFIDPETAFFKGYICIKVYKTLRIAEMHSFALI